jgi:hypothetical protein
MTDLDDYPKLRLLRPDDYDELYEFVTVADGGLSDRFHGETPSPQDFVKGLWVGVLVQFVAEWKGEPIGLLVAHSPNLLDGTCRLALIAYRESHNRAHEAALRQFIDYLLANWEIRRMYVEVSERQRPEFLARGGHLFSEEGCLREHEFYEGRYWSRYIYGLRRDQWPNTGSAHEAPPPSGNLS